MIHRQQGKGDSISLTPLYHFHPLHRHLGSSQAIAVENSPQHLSQQPNSNREPLVSEGKWVTIKLRSFNFDDLMSVLFFIIFE